MIIYRSSTTADREELWRFYKKAYREKYEFLIDPYWSWLNTENPLHENKQVTNTYLAIDDEKKEVAGHYTIIPQDFMAAGRPVRFSWGINLFVLPEYRGQGIAKKLQTLLIKKHDIYTAISIAASTRNMIMGMHGAIELPDTFTLSLPLFAGKEQIMDLKMKNYRLNPGRHWLSALLNRSGKLKKTVTPLLTYRTAKKTGNLRKKLPGTDSFSVIRETGFENADFLKIRAEIQHYFEGAPNDSPAYLKWKFKQHPAKQYRLFVYKTGDDGETGFVILRTGIAPEQNIGIISEIFATSKESLDELIAFATAYFLEQKCRVAHVVVQHPDYVKAFEKAGFLITNRRKPVALATEKDKITFLENIKTWFFTFESQDLDFYPNTRL